MRLKSFLLTLLAVSFFMLDCSPASNVTQQPKPFPLGDYQYTGYGSNGDKIVEGQLSITSIESDRLKGNWQLNKVGDAERIGPQVGTGSLIGSIIKGETYINLNPNMADNNVNLRGKIEGNRFHGTWSFDGYTGGMNKGTFEARRK